MYVIRILSFSSDCSLTFQFSVQKHFLISVPAINPPSQLDAYLLLSLQVTSLVRRPPRHSWACKCFMYVSVLSFTYRGKQGGVWLRLFVDEFKSHYFLGQFSSKSQSYYTDAKIQCRRSTACNECCKIKKKAFLKVLFY